LPAQDEFYSRERNGTVTHPFARPLLRPSEQGVTNLGEFSVLTEPIQPLRATSILNVY
jgi:hypothetical protein